MNEPGEVVQKRTKKPPDGSLHATRFRPEIEAARSQPHAEVTAKTDPCSQPVDDDATRI